MIGLPLAQDPYLDPDTGVLRNRLGARTAADLAQREANITAAALYRIDLHPIAGRYDLEHLQAIHAALFGDIYDWAGQLRTTGLAKHEAFCPSPLIQTQAQLTFGKLAAEDHLRGLDPERFTDRLAGYYAAVNQLHPFREGNGRTQRAFFTQLARDAGYEIEWEHLDPHVNIAACRQTLYGDLDPLRIVFADISRPQQPIYTTPAGTAERLDRRADQARHTAQQLYRRACHWLDHDQTGPNQTHLLAYRAEHNRAAQAIQQARNAQADYRASLAHLDQLEQQHAQLLTRLNAVDDRGRPTTRGHSRADLQHHLDQITAHLTTARQQALDHAAHAGQTTATAPPPHLWDTHERENFDLNTHWNHYLAAAKDTDQALAASQCTLADWLTNQADQLNDLAIAVQTSQIAPAQTNTPAGAILPNPTPAPAPPHPQPVTMQP